MGLKDSLVREMLGGLHRSGTALIKKGTAMDPLIPMLVLVPILGGLAWLFREVAVVRGVPCFTALFVVGIIGIIGTYLRHYARFARTEPDRLQSERYRVRMEQFELQRILAKEGVLPPDAVEPPTANPVAATEEGEAQAELEQRGDPTT